jgi:hypothetical protein
MGHTTRAPCGNACYVMQVGAHFRVEEQICVDFVNEVEAHFELINDIRSC